MKHRRTLNREDLLHRYSRVTGFTFGKAHDRAADLTNEQLRDRVEFLEQETARRGQRQTFARSQPTTSVEGQTR